MYRARSWCISIDTEIIETRNLKIVGAYQNSYKRHGALKLFAAVGVVTDPIKAQITGFWEWLRPYPNNNACLAELVTLRQSGRTPMPQNMATIRVGCCLKGSVELQTTHLDLGQTVYADALQARIAWPKIIIL